MSSSNASPRRTSLLATTALAVTVASFVPASAWAQVDMQDQEQDQGPSSEETTVKNILPRQNDGGYIIYTEQLPSKPGLSLDLRGNHTPFREEQKKAEKARDEQRAEHERLQGLAGAARKTSEGSRGERDNLFQKVWMPGVVADEEDGPDTSPPSGLIVDAQDQAAALNGRVGTVGEKFNGLSDTFGTHFGTDSAVQTQQGEVQSQLANVQDALEALKTEAGETVSTDDVSREVEDLAERLTTYEEKHTALGESIGNTGDRKESGSLGFQVAYLESAISSVNHAINSAKNDAQVAVNDESGSFAQAQSVVNTLRSYASGGDSVLDGQGLNGAFQNIVVAFSELPPSSGPSALSVGKVRRAFEALERKLDGKDQGVAAAISTLERRLEDLEGKLQSYIDAVTAARDEVQEKLLALLSER